MTQLQSSLPIAALRERRRPARSEPSLLHARELLFVPGRVADGLERAGAAGFVERPPRCRQSEPGVPRMWRRVLLPAAARDEREAP